MTICHIPPGNPDNAHTIVVGISAVPAHLAHGDALEACSEETCKPQHADCSSGDECCEGICSFGRCQWAYR